MMKRRVMLMWAAVLGLTAGVAGAAVEAHYEEDSIKIQEAGPFDEQKQVKIEVGEQVTYVIKVYQDAEKRKRGHSNFLKKQNIPFYLLAPDP